MAKADPTQKTADEVAKEAQATAMALAALNAAKQKTGRSSMLGDVFTYDDAKMSELILRDFSVFDSSMFKTEVSDVAEFDTNSVNFGSDDEEIGMVYTATKKIDKVNLKYVGVMGPNLQLLPFTNDGVRWDLVSSFYQTLLKMLAKLDLDRYYSQVLLATFSSVNEIAYERNETNTGFDFVFTSPEVIMANGVSKFTEKAVLVPEYIAAAAADKPKKLKTIIEEMIITNKLTEVRIPSHLMFKAVAAVWEAISTNVEFVGVLGAAMGYQTYTGLFFRMKDEAQSALGKSGYSGMAIDGTISYSAGNIRKKHNEMRVNTAFSTAFKDMLGSVVNESTLPTNSQDNKVNLIRRKLTDLFYGTQADEWVTLIKNLNEEEIEFPSFYLNFKPYSVTSDKVSWQMTGYCIDPESIAARLFLFSMVKGFTKLSYGMLRCSEVNVILSDDVAKSSKEIMDTIYNMAATKSFKPAEIKHWFIDKSNLQVDLKSMRRAMLMYRAFVFLDDYYECFTNREEVMSQIPELWPGVYTINDYYTTLKMKSNEQYLYVAFRNDIEKLKPFVKNISQMAKKYVPRFDFKTESQFNIFEAMAQSGIGFASTFEIVHFGTFKGSIPLFSGSIAFGTPKLKPILLAHFGYDPKECMTKAREVGTRSIFLNSNIGIFTHAWTQDFQIIRAKDSFSPRDIPGDVKSYILLQGNTKVECYSLFTEVNLTSYVYPDKYEGNAGIVFRPGP